MEDFDPFLNEIHRIPTLTSLYVAFGSAGISEDGKDTFRNKEKELVKEELQALQERYIAECITKSEMSGIIRELEKLPASDL